MQKKGEALLCFLSGAWFWSLYLVFQKCERDNLLARIQQIKIKKPMSILYVICKHKVIFFILNVVLNIRSKVGLSEDDIPEKSWELS